MYIRFLPGTLPPLYQELQVGWTSTVGATSEVVCSIHSRATHGYTTIEALPDAGGHCLGAHPLLLDLVGEAVGIFDALDVAARTGITIEKPSAADIFGH